MAVKVQQGANPLSKAKSVSFLFIGRIANVAEYGRLLGSGATIDSLEIEMMHAAIGSNKNTLLGVIYYDRKAFLIQCNAKTPELINVYREAMQATIRSFHILSADEKKAIKPFTLKLITAKKDDTYAKLAQRSPLGKGAESYLRLINAQYPQGEPTAGQSIKVIE